MAKHDLNAERVRRREETKRRRDARERAEALERRRHQRRAVAAATLAMVCAVLSVISGALADQPAPVPISAEISHTGSVQVTFAKPLSSATSPACGCLRHDPPGGWQGVVMPARTVSLRRSGQNPLTQYDIFNPGPAQWGSMPDSRGIRAKVATIVTGAPPTVQRLLSALRHAPRGVNLLTADAISVTTAGALTAASLGREPVAALGFPSRTAAQIDYRHARDRRDADMTITAAFGDVRQRGGDETDSMPLLDILGPRVLLWAPTQPEHAYDTAVWERPPEPYEPGGTASDLGLEMSVLPAAFDAEVPRGQRAYTVILVDEGAFALRIGARPGAADDWTTSEDLPADAGKLVVTVPRAASQASALVPIFKRADANPQTSLDKIPMVSDKTMTRRRSVDMPPALLYYEAAQQFEYPPTPPESGINIFGAVDTLRLADARGDFTIGTKPLALRAKTPLELRRFKSLRDPEHRLLIPVQIDENSARFDIQGHADTRLNGEPLATSRPWLARALAPGIVTLLGAVATVVLLAASQFERREGRRI